VKVFTAAHTSSNPVSLDNTSKIIDYGVYGYSRNPMYIGMMVMIIGFMIFLGDVSGLFGCVMFYLVITYLQIIPEERFLETKFGTDYIEYKKRVNRWIGR
jgi:protein-S-isoprenylcysteine O-methyltransferase Ste14